MASFLSFFKIDLGAFDIKRQKLCPVIKLFVEMLSFIFGGLLTEVCSSTQLWMHQTFSRQESSRRQNKSSGPQINWNNKTNATQTVTVNDSTSLMWQLISSIQSEDTLIGGWRGGVHCPFFPHSPCDGLPNTVISAEAVIVSDSFSLKQQLISRMFSFLFRGLFNPGVFLNTTFHNNVVGRPLSDKTNPAACR
ncbi:hypothetical protein CDAR_46141 [Caerostris darwini]|uniref:Uncharacterized protein n=1 Tax=Caerostris darwini TaxID=1538125 RepID=A0AAV4UIY9_9ARAC|nr:hypothetical protein CDAR_46141 [Caerostris darwini]